MKKRSKIKSLISFFVIFTFIIQACVFPAASVTALADDTVTTVTRLQTEYLTNPIGIDITKPRFSWNLESNGFGIMQTSYQILVATSLAGLESGPYVWDSGVVNSSDSIGIAYNGSPLAASTRYFWKVNVTVNNGTVDNSETAYWETGLMSNKIGGWGGAQWITMPYTNVASDYTTYTIDFDFKIVKDNAGFYFAATDLDPWTITESNCFMWQFNTYEHKDAQGNRLFYLRPHRWTNGAPSVLAEVDASDVVPLEAQNDWLHCRISMYKGGRFNAYTYLDTYIGSDANNLTKIHSYTGLGATMVGLGKIGIRQTIDSKVDERAEFDNFVIRDSANASGDAVGNIIFSEDFSNYSSLKTFPGDYLTKEGALYVAGSGPDFLQCHSKFLTPTPINSPFGGRPRYSPMLRRDFTVDTSKTVESARLYATARGIYEFSINGEKVGKNFLDPGWTDYNYNFQYQTFDVTDMLKSGQNAIGAMLGAGWYSSKMCIFGPDRYSTGLGEALLGRLVIKYTDGTTSAIVTDTTNWKYTASPILASDNFDGEWYNATMEKPGWNKAGYDTTGWRTPIKASALPISININAQTAPSVQKITTLKPMNYTEPVAGRYIYDFGQNMVGNIQIKLKGNKGDVVRFRYAEMLNTENAYKDANGNVFGGGDDLPGTLYLSALRTARATDVYTLKGDPNGEVYMPRFTFHGFRYLEISGVSEPIALDDIEGVVLSSNNEYIGSFESSNELVNKLYSNIIWGQRGNFVSIPTDCPQRDERLGWTGDTQIFAKTAMYIQNANQFYSKWLTDLRSWQSAQTGPDTGRVPDVVPSCPPMDGSNSGWGDSAVIVPWQMYQMYGDKAILSDSYDSMKAWVDYLNRNLSGNLRPADAYGDWLAPEKAPAELTNSIYVAYVNKLVAKSAQILGKPAADVTRYTNYYNNVLAAINSKYANPDGSLKTDTQTPYAMMLAFDMLPTSEKTAQYAQLLKENIMTRGYHLSTGFIGVSYLAPSLSNNGYVDAAYRLLEQDTYPSWIYSIKNGATTLWERWNSFTLANGFGDVSMNSFNHYSFGAIGEWMYSGILGIQVDGNNPGFKKFFLDPLPGGSLTYAKGSYQSVNGLIESAWVIEDGLFKYDCTVPANTTATVYLPTDNENALINVPDGATVIGIEKGKLALSVGSGTYHFEVPYSKSGNVKFVSIANPQGINAVVSVDGVEYPLPFNNEIPVSTEEVKIISKDPNYAFAYLSGSIWSTYNPIRNVTDGMTVNANFKYVATEGEPSLSIPASDLSGGKIYYGNSVADSSEAIDASFDKGTDVVVDVVPPAGYKMMGWADDSVKLPSVPGIATLDGNLKLKPVFEVPKQYSNVARASKVTTNDELSAVGFVTNRLIDGIKTSDIGWSTDKNYPNGDASASPVYLKFDLGTETSVEKVVIYPRSDLGAFQAEAFYFPRDFKVFVSTDGENMKQTQVLNIVNHADTSDPVEFEFAAVKARYVYFEFTRTAEKTTEGDKHRFQICEIEIMKSVPYTGNPVSSIDIAPVSGGNTINVGDTVKLTAKVNPSNADAKGVTWYIRDAVLSGDNPLGNLSDKGEGVVSTNGDSFTFTAVKPGYVEIVAYANDKFGAIGHYRINIKDEGALDVATVAPGTIIGGQKANVIVNIDMSKVDASETIGVELFGKSALVGADGVAKLSLPAGSVPNVTEDTTESIKVFYANDDGSVKNVISSVNIAIKANTSDIWATSYTLNDDGSATITFNSPIAVYAKTSVTVNGASAAFDFDAEANSITVQGVAKGSKIVVNNLKLPTLYPTYSFKFTVDLD